MKIEIKYEVPSGLSRILTDKNYLSFLSKKLGYICGIEDHVICYVIPFVIKKRLIFEYMQLISETICLADTKTDEKEFLNLAVLKIKREKLVDFIGQPKNNVVFKNVPDHSIFAPFGSYQIDLSLDEETLFSNIHGKHKNVIKRALKNNVNVEFGNQLFDQAYKIIFETLERNNIGMEKKSKLELLVEAKPNNVLIGCSYLENITQSAVIILFDNYKAYYFWGGSNINITLGANNLLHWEVIKKLKQTNVNYYDFVGARINSSDQKLLGIQRFKSRFGSVLNEGYLWKYPIKKWKYSLFYFLYKLKMKKGDVIDQEKNNTNIRL